MDNYQILYEIIGYTGTTLIAISLMMSSISRLRKINLVGATTFALYGFLVQAYPVFFLNSFIALIDIYYIVKLYSQKDYFELFEINSIQNLFLQRFLKFYAADIRKFFPDFTLSQEIEYVVYFVLRNMLPVGVFIAQPDKDRTLHICLDYVVPSYRDLKSAHFLFHQQHSFFQHKGYHSFTINSNVTKHTDYLRKLGFEKADDLGSGWYRKTILK